MNPLKPFRAFMANKPGLTSSLRSAAGWGAAGGVMGGLQAEKGQRLKGVAKGVGLGAAGGAVAPHAERGVMKLVKGASFDRGLCPVTPEQLVDASEAYLLMKQGMSKAADFEDENGLGGPIPPKKKKKAELTKYTKEKLSGRKFTPEEMDAIQQRVNRYFPSKPLASQAAGAIKDVRRTRAQIYGGSEPVVKKAGVREGILSAIPAVLKTPEGAALTLAGALGLGASSVLRTRPKKELGGRSRPEVGFEAQLKGLEPPKDSDSFRQRMKRHNITYRKGMSEELRKSPVAAGAMGAAAGAFYGSLAAKLLGAAKNAL